MQDLSFCREPALPGELLLAASLDLEQLDCIGSDWGALDELRGGPLLVAELADGNLCMWPELPEGWSPREFPNSDQRGTAPPAASSSEPDQVGLHCVKQLLLSQDWAASDEVLGCRESLGGGAASSGEPRSAMRRSCRRETKARLCLAAARLQGEALPTRWSAL